MMSGEGSEAAGSFEDRVRACKDLLRRCKRVVVAYSGGVDSTLLLALAKETLGSGNVLAAVGVSPSLPHRECVQAREVAAENAIKDAGFPACRVRDYGAIARIEVPVADFSRLLEHRDKMIAAIEEVGYAYVCLDLKGLRSGSMNEVLVVQDHAEGYGRVNAKERKKTGVALGLVIR